MFDLYFLVARKLHALKLKMQAGIIKCQVGTGLDATLQPAPSVV